MLAPLIEDTRRAIEAALAEPDLERVAAALRRSHIEETCDALVTAVTTFNGMQAALKAIRIELSEEPSAPLTGVFERLLLLRQARKALPQIDSLPVSEDVKRLFCEEFRYVARPPRQVTFHVMRARFVAQCELASLRRFPAGQFHWTVSGLPRSWVMKVKGRDRLRLLYWIARRMRGFGPVFFPHLNANRRNRWLTELEANRSYYRMAQSMMFQPAVKGLVASSWLRSPDTAKVSPHLEWVNRTMLENGGLVVVMGPADPDCGVLTGSLERRRLYDAGVFKPTIGLTIWPRDAMLAWAERHPELRREDPRALSA